MLPELPLLLPLQVSEIMSTLVTLKVFCAEAPDVPEEAAEALDPLSQLPFSATS